MNDKQTKQRYEHLAQQWGFTPKQVDEASRAVFLLEQKVFSQSNYEILMKEYLDKNYAIPNTNNRKTILRKKVSRVTTPTFADRADAIRDMV